MPVSYTLIPILKLLLKNETPRNSGRKNFVSFWCKQENGDYC